MAVRLILVLMLVSVAAGCGGGGGGGDGDGGGGSGDDREAPSKPAIVAVFSADTDKLSITWLPSVDNNTHSDDLAYAIHASKTQNFVPDGTSLQQEITGNTSVNLAGLEAATTYYLAIIAKDESGNASAASDQGSGTTATVPMALKGQATQTAAGLNLAEPTISADGITYTYLKSADTQLPEVGAILFGIDSDGSGYMRKVVTVTDPGGQVIVTTEDASLDEIIDQGLFLYFQVQLSPN